MNQEKRVLIAIFLSMLIIVSWQQFYVQPMLASQDPVLVAPTKLVNGNTVPQAEKSQIKDRSSAVSQGYHKGERVAFSNNELTGSINLLGARIDDLVLRKYKLSINDNTPVTMLSPSHTDQVYFMEVGWLSPDHKVIVPNSSTLWHADKKDLGANEMVKLYWVNPQGIRFEIHFTITDDFMFNIVQEVKNSTDTPIKLQKYALLNRTEFMPQDSSMVVHEGAIGVFNDSLHEIAFGDIERAQSFATQRGWIGFSDKYWLAALIPHDQFQGGFSAFKTQDLPRFQADMNTEAVVVEPGQTNSQAMFFFAGAKKLDLLDFYRGRFNIPLFDRAVDFGILYFITKPILTLLHLVYDYTGNFGIAILILTVIIKVLLFPLAYKGYKGMNRLKDLQPKMAELREKYKDDAGALQKAMMELYKREQVNPLSGCFPILLQAPVFFALYKVLYVSIEMRQAPFFAWIVDLSSPDPTNVFTLFGLLPWTPPAMLMVGVFPLLMALTMYVQQRLNPEPADPTQAQVMKLLPLMFLFMFASFPAGLVVYWTWSNVLSIAQQLIIKRMTGSKRSTTRKAKA